MLYVEFYRAAIIRTVISFKDSYYEVWVWSFPQDLEGTGNNQVNKRLFDLTLILCYFSFKCGLGLIVHYIKPTALFQKITSTLTHTSAYKKTQKDSISNVLKWNNWHMQCISIFKIYFSSIKTPYHSFKTKVIMIKFCLYERF